MEQQDERLDDTKQQEEGQAGMNTISLRQLAESGT
jgi:hypothetical protein